MNYEQFCTALSDSLAAKTAPKLTVTRKQIPKNNGIHLDALWLHQENMACSPVVYLQPLYQEYRSGRPLEELSLSILRSIRRDRPLSLTLPDLILDAALAREHITFRLISHALNEPLLDELPWFPFLDLAIVFYLQLPSDSGQTSSVCISHSLTQLWEITPDELHRLAFQNTPRLFPPVLDPLEQMIAKYTKSSLPALSDRPLLHVLTNRSASFGAACLLYDGLIKKFAGHMQSDVLILPSSIHEVLLLPRTARLSVAELRQTVQWVNETIVDRQELLSDEVYLYEQKTDRFTVCPPDPPSSHDTPETGGKTNP